MVRRLVLVVAFALGATTVFVGCGSEETPNEVFSVDTVPPAAVANLAATVKATSTPCVELSWNPGFEADLAGYRVYRLEYARGTGSTKRGLARIDGMTLLHEVTQSQCVDSNVVLGQSYYYAVSAFDAAGNESPRTMTGEVVVAPRNPAPPNQHLSSD